MNLLPKISIIMPVFNSAKYIEEAIQSVVNQNYPSMEFIIIDGISTDGSLDIIRKHEDKIDVVVSEADKGLSHAVNKGIFQANGDYIGWLNADDRYQPGALEKVGKYLAENPDVDLLYGEAGRIDKNDRFFGLHHAVPFDRGKLLHERCYIPCQAAFFRRDCLSYIGLVDTSLSWNMDWDMWKRFAVAGYKIQFLDERLGDWRIHDESLSYEKKGKVQFKRILETFRSTKKYSEKWITPLEIKLLPWLIICSLGLYSPLRSVWHRIKKFLRTGR